MITQTIKRWFGKLFAWWPRQRSATTATSPTEVHLTKGRTTDHTWWQPVDGPVARPNITSVAVEQEYEKPFSDPADDRSEPITQPSPELQAPPLSSSPSFMETAEMHPNMPSPVSGTEPPTSTATVEQRLAFLRYLVQRGIVNEHGHRPEDMHS